MTNMADCIARGMDFGEIDRERGVTAMTQYEQLVERYSTIMDQAQARGPARRWTCRRQRQRPRLSAPTRC